MCLQWALERLAGMNAVGDTPPDSDGEGGGGRDRMS